MPASFASAAQFDRWQVLVAWLREGRRFSAASAARTLGVSARTIGQDLAGLRTRGVPVYWHAARARYALAGELPALPLLALSGRELAALLVAHHALDALGDTDDAALLEGVTERLAASLPDTVRVGPATLSARVRLGAGGPVADARPLFHGPLLDAIAERCVVALRYRSASKAEVTDRRVEPLALVEHGRRWYLVAFCHLRDGLRDFRLDRIVSLEVTSAQAASRPFDLDAYLEGSFGMHRGDRTYSVHLRFSPYQARWIREEQWHPTQVLTLRADGSLDLRMQAQGLDDLTRWVLSYGAEVEVLAPTVLRARVSHHVHQLALRYAAPNA